VSIYNAHTAENWVDWDLAAYSELADNYAQGTVYNPWPGFVFQMHLFGWLGRGG
jgi:hypothetical protein